MATDLTPLVAAAYERWLGWERRGPRWAAPLRYENTGELTGDMVMVRELPAPDGDFFLLLCDAIRAAGYTVRLVFDDHDVTCDIWGGEPHERAGLGIAQTALDATLRAAKEVPRAK